MSYELTTKLPYVYFGVSLLVSFWLAGKARSRVNECGIFLIVLGLLVVPVWHYLRPHLGLYGPKHDFIRLSANVRLAENRAMMEKMLTPEAFAKLDALLKAGDDTDPFWKELGHEQKFYIACVAHRDPPPGNMHRFPPTKEHITMLYEMLKQNVLPNTIQAELNGDQEGYALRRELDADFKAALPVAELTEKTARAQAQRKPPAQAAPAVLVKPTAQKTVVTNQDNKTQLPTTSILRTGTVVKLSSSVVIKSPDGSQKIISISMLTPDEQSWLEANSK